MAVGSIVTTALKNTLLNLEKAKSNSDNPQLNVNQGRDQNFDSNKGIQDVTDIRIDPSSLTNKAAELQGRIAQIDANVGVLKGAVDALKQVEEQIRSADTVAGQALKEVANLASQKQEVSADSLSGFSTLFNDALSKINEIVSSQDERSVNLLRGDALKTQFTSNNDEALVTQGGDVTPKGLGLDNVQFTSLSDITNTLDVLRSAIEGVRGLLTAVEIDLQDIETKQDFTSGTIEVLRAGVNDLDAIGQADEGANLLARQAALLIESGDDSLVAEAQSELLNLF